MKKLANRKVLGAIAALVLAATVVMGREKPTLDLQEKIERKTESLPELDLSRLDRATVATPQPDGDPFAAKSFAPAAQQQAQAQAVQPPPVPQAPPLPFRYIGRLVDGGKTVIFLANGDENLTVQAGQKLGEYKVEKVTDSEVVFTYVPLQTTQVLPL